MPTIPEMLTPRDYALLAILALFAFGVLALAVLFVARWLAARRDPIDALIAANTFRYGTGMDEIDWNKTERAGERVWQQTVRAQRKDRTQPTPRLLKIADRCR